MADPVTEMTQARMTWVSPRLREWYDDARLTRQLASGLSVEAGRLGDVAFGTEFRDGVGTGVSDDPLDWANRLIDLATGGRAVTGIRFRSLDVNRPFVDVVATTAPPTADGLAAVAASVVPAFEPFGPLCLRVDVPDPDALLDQLVGDERFGPGCAVDQYVVAGVVRQLRSRPRSPSYDLVSLRHGDASAMAERAAAI